MGPLRKQLAGLYKNYADTSKNMERVEVEFWENGGICCPMCGVDGWYELEQKQKRRLARIETLNKRLESCMAITGKGLYEKYMKVYESLDVMVDHWDDLDPLDRQAWGRLADELLGE